MKTTLKFLPALVSLILLTLYSHAQTRTEKDLLGEKQIPNSAYYGVQTARALENFQISGVTTQFYPDYVRAFAMVKLAAARANAKTGRLKKVYLGILCFW
jgi:aspartate ammonia-lyase